MPNTPSVRQALPRLWVLALAVAVFMALLAAAALWQQRRDAIDGQAREIAVLSLALADEVERSLQGVSDGLFAVRTELRDSGLPMNPAEATHLLRMRASLLSQVRAVWVADGKATVLAASGPARPPDLAGFAPALRDLAEDDVAVSRSFTDPATREDWVALAVRVMPAGSHTSWWVLAAMPTSTLLGAFSSASPAADARMAVFRNDGARLAGAIVDHPALNEGLVAQRLTQARRADLRTLSDGSERLVDLRSLPRYRLKVVLTRHLDGVLQAWQETVRLTAGVMALLWAVVALSMHRVQAADQRRAEAQRKLQAQMARSNRLESLGTLAGGVAHDFNNVLAGVLGWGEMARDAAPAGSDQARQLDHLLRAALRGKALVERIVRFSRSGGRRATVFELQPVVEEALTLVEASLPPRMRIVPELRAQHARVRGDTTQAFEAVMNLCTNAVQAMPDGGTLRVGLQRHGAAQPRVLSHAQLPAGDYLALTVEDEGSGITGEMMDRLFAPFVTTRAAEGGTGLGLAVVHGIVTEMRGAIDVHSAPGRGARFTLFLPECQDAATAAPEDLPAPAAGSGQRVLVVDDDPELVALAEEMLAHLGYEPVGFTDPRAALAHVRDALQEVDAVVTDEGMPGMSGTQLAEALRALAPNLPVLLITGYGGPHLAARASQAGVSRVLSKPLQRAELAHALAELMRHPPPASTPSSG